MHMHNLLNEFADLSQRLEHLIAYSSQMVFISGEQMGNQQKFVEAFLGARQNEMDIIYLTGNSFHNEEDVRTEFAKQLLGQAPRLDLSLLQLLSTRENKSLPLLITITRAERLPDQILQELWDLVLQNRFARNHQQINILLFGEQEWAERTKAWLPTNNNDKPVLLTSETVEVQAEQEVEGDLDAYIKEKRKEFNERLKTRALAYEPPKSVWKNWWIKLLALCTFIVCFSGIMIWQYFDLTESAMKDFASFIFQKEVSDVTPSEEWQETQELLAETQELQVNEQTSEANASEQLQESQPEEHQEQGSQKFVTNWKDESEKLARQSIELNLPKEQNTKTQTQTANTTSQPESMNTAQGGLEMYESESLVKVTKEQLLKLQPKTTSSTPNAEKTVVEKLTTEPVQPNSQEEPTVITEPLIPNELSSTLAKNPKNIDEMVGPPAPERSNEEIVLEGTIQAETNQEGIQDASVAAPQNQAAGAVEDYQIQDIVSVEELDQQQSQAAATTIEQPATPAYEFDEATLLNFPDSDHLLQVSGISSRSVLDQYLADNKLTNQVWIYKTKRYGGDWYVVLYRKSYSSLNNARDSVSELPRTTRQSAPFAKSIAMIRKEIAQGYPEN